MGTSGLVGEQAALAFRLEGSAAMMANTVEDNSKRSQDQDNCQRRFSELEKQHADACARCQAIVAGTESKQGRAAQTQHHLNTVGAINPNGTISFHFKWDANL